MSKNSILVAIGIVLVIALAGIVIPQVIIQGEKTITTSTTPAPRSDKDFSTTTSTTKFMGASINETIATTSAPLNNLTLGNDIFLGKWKEDQSKRQNLNDFLYYRGISWVKRKAAGNSDNWWLTMNITRNGNIYTFKGKKGYYMAEYKFTLTPDNNTPSNLDWGNLGGPLIATAKFIDDGNTLMTQLRKPNTGKIDVETFRTIDPNFPNVMSYKIKDVASGTILIQHMDKQS